jgi:hypothetical protein
MALVVGLSSLGASRDAGATNNCYNGSGNYPAITSNTDPMFETCLFSDYVTTGPATSLLAQDQSGSTTSSTYGFVGTSLYNIGIYGYSQYGSIAVQANGGAGIGFYGIGGSTSGSGVTPSGSHYYGVYGTSAGDDGVSGQVGLT